jgi:hypothetical protein
VKNDSTDERVDSISMGRSALSPNTKRRNINARQRRLYHQKKTQRATDSIIQPEERLNLSNDSDGCFDGGFGDFDGQDYLESEEGFIDDTHDERSRQTEPTDEIPKRSSFVGVGIHSYVNS